MLLTVKAGLYRLSASCFALPQETWVRSCKIQWLAYPFENLRRKFLQKLTDEFAQKRSFGQTRPFCQNLIQKWRTSPQLRIQIQNSKSWLQHYTQIHVKSSKPGSASFSWKMHTDRRCLGEDNEAKKTRSLLLGNRVSPEDVQDVQSWGAANKAEDLELSATLIFGAGSQRHEHAYLQTLIWFNYLFNLIE